MPEEVKLKKYEDVLMSAFTFDEDDLAANNSGTMSVAQVKDLQRRRAKQAITIASMCGIVALLALFLVNVAPITLMPMIYFVVLFTMLALLSGSSTLVQLTRDLRTGIKVAEGRVELDMRSVEHGAAFFVKLDRLKFKTKREGFLAFKNGDPYRIYYAPHTKTILSVAWLRDDNPFAEDRDTSRLEDTESMPAVESEEKRKASR